MSNSIVINLVTSVCRPEILPRNCFDIVLHNHYACCFATIADMFKIYTPLIFLTHSMYNYTKEQIQITPHTPNMQDLKSYFMYLFLHSSTNHHQIQRDTDFLFS